MARDILKLSEQGRKKIEGARRLDITPKELAILYDRAKDDTIFTAIADAFYYGVEQGYKLRKKEENS